MPSPTQSAPAPARPRISRRRYVLFAVVAVVGSLLLGLSSLLAADLYLHRRAERSAGLNAWGYRGTVLGRKLPGEVRIAFLGGSAMFGYGVTWDEAIPALVEARLNERGAAPVRSANLAMNNEGAYSFLYTLQDYAYLNYDIVVLYEGYNDLQGDEDENRSLFRHDSPVFRLTGYVPILPMVLEERAMLFRYGDLNAAYEATRGVSPTVFRPGLADRSAAAVLEAAASVGNSFGRGLGRIADSPAQDAAEPLEAGCAPPWSLYCHRVFRAVENLREQSIPVAVVSQPSVVGKSADRHAEQQRALAAMLEDRYAHEARVLYLDFSRTVNLADNVVAFDAMHLTPDGNRVVAQALADALTPVVAQVRRTRP